MAILIVTADTLLGFAQDPRYGWMRSLEVVRQVLGQSGPGCGTCGSNAASTSHNLTKKTYLAVAGSGQFRTEIKEVAKALRYTAVEILMDGTNDQLALS